MINTDLSSFRAIPLLASSRVRRCMRESTSAAVAALWPLRRAIQRSVPSLLPCCPRKACKVSGKAEFVLVARQRDAGGGFEHRIMRMGCALRDTKAEPKTKQHHNQRTSLASANPGRSPNTGAAMLTPPPQPPVLSRRRLPSRRREVGSGPLGSTSVPRPSDAALQLDMRRITLYPRASGLSRFLGVL